MRKFKNVLRQISALFRYRLYGAQLRSDMCYIVWAGSKEEALVKLYAKMHADPRYKALIEAPELSPELEFRAELARAHFRTLRLR